MLFVFLNVWLFLFKSGHSFYFKNLTVALGFEHTVHVYMCVCIHACQSFYMCLCFLVDSGVQTILQVPYES